MSNATVNEYLWLIEWIAPTEAFHHGVKKILAHKRTAFQDMYVVENELLGKALVLDGLWQSSTSDEFLYHEPLVHPAFLHHGEPKNVLILGGGEGATVREALKWKSVERVVMVDLDGEVVEACREHLPEMHQGAFDDPRTELVIEDALHYLDQSENEWDVIISDLSDPIEEGPSFALFTQEYFQKCRRALKPDGCLVVQSGPVAPTGLRLHARLSNTLSTVFDHTASYSSFVPTYVQPWSFIMASASPISTRPDPETTDEILAEKTSGEFKMFDGTTLLGLLNVPKHLRTAIAEETEIYTSAKPPVFAGSAIAGEVSKG